MSGAVAVGVFDGLHLGHAEIVRRALERARRHGGPCVVLTFDPHPDVVLAKRFHAVAPLTPLPEKRQWLTAMGVDRFELLPFTRELAALTPEEFVDVHLVRPFACRALVAGANFALGRGRAGTVERLTEIGRRRGFEVEAVPLLEADGVPISSTRIRALLSEGRVREASVLLGRRYGLNGRVVPGESIGRTLGVPTANLRLHEEKMLPRDGIYATWVWIGDDDERRPGAMSVGVRPTFGGQVRTLEVHLLDWSEELGGRELRVEFVDWLRPQIKFEDRDGLIAAMRSDIAEVRRRLTSAGSTEAPGAAPRAR